MSGQHHAARHKYLGVRVLGGKDFLFSFLGEELSLVLYAMYAILSVLRDSHPRNQSRVQLVLSGIQNRDIDPYSVLRLHDRSEPRGTSTAPGGH
jgi:hypothetical protein